MNRIRKRITALLLAVLMALTIAPTFEQSALASQNTGYHVAYTTTIGDWQTEWINSNAQGGRELLGVAASQGANSESSRIHAYFRRGSEYRVAFTTTIGGDGQTEWINDNAQGGWELVGVAATQGLNAHSSRFHAYFRRGSEYRVAFTTTMGDWQTEWINDNAQGGWELLGVAATQGSNSESSRFHAYFRRGSEYRVAFTTNVGDWQTEWINDNAQGGWELIGVTATQGLNAHSSRFHAYYRRGSEYRVAFTTTMGGDGQTEWINDNAQGGWELVAVASTQGLNAQSSRSHAYFIGESSAPHPETFVPVTDITGVPTTTVAGTTLTLTGTVAPANATNRTIAWSIASAGTTGATISGSALNTTAAGSVVVTATIVDGVAVGTPFVRNFTITVTNPPTARRFTMGVDNYRFVNSRGSFGYSSTYRIPLERFNEIYSPAAAQMYFQNNSLWGGSCFGFATTAYAFYEGKLQHSAYQSGVSRTFDFSAPGTPNSALTRLIELYQISWNLPNVSSSVGSAQAWNNLPGLISAANDEDALIVYISGDAGAHAIVAYDVESLGGTRHSIRIYDMNQPNNVNLRIEVDTSMTGSSAWTFIADTQNYNVRLGRNISFVRGATVFNAIESARNIQSSGIAAMQIMASAHVNITNMQGVGVENISGAYQVVAPGVLPLNPDGSDPTPRRDTALWVVPTGRYTITSQTLEPFIVMVLEGGTAYSVYVTPEGAGASVVVGDGLPQIIGPAHGQITRYDDQPTEQPSSWAAEEVNAAIAAGLVPASLQSRYTSQITRAEYCALAVMLYEKFTGAVITQRRTFVDTNDVNVEKMAAVGVVEGVGNNRFDPNGLLTREQAATMLSRLATSIGRPLPRYAAAFADNSSISSWAIEGVGQVQAAGIMQGVGANMFSPKGPYTREQSIITMIRLWNEVN